MKRRIASACVLTLTAALVLGGCSSSSTYGKYLTLGDYKGLEVTKIKTEITDEVLEEELQYVLDDNTEYTEVDRAAKDGDMVNMNYTATFKSGEEFEGNSEEDVDIELGQGYMEGYFLEDAEDDLIGMKSGETKNVEVTVSDDYFDETLAGQDLMITLTVNTVCEVVRPELTDELVSSISDFSTVEEYKENLREILTTSAEENNAYTAGSDALQQVVQNSTFKGYPQELYDECKDTYDQTNAAYAEMLGLDVSDFALSDEETKEAVESMVYEEMVVTAIAEKEKLTVSDDEYTEFIEANLEYYDMSSVEEFEATYSKESTVNELLREKVQDFLLDNATVTEVSEDEYYQEYDEGENVIDLSMDGEDAEFEDIEDNEALELEDIDATEAETAE